ncbi:MAG TPA: peptidylprolyl isomerase [Polyangiaceae bacterium]|nr:peptidylprolyl isomerase [Polyangiaceae bacterium]
MKASFSIFAATLALSACSKTQPEPGSGSSAESTSPTGATAAAAPQAARLASILHPDLLDPSKATAKAPDTFKAKFTTARGDFVVQVHREWSPNGADRFYNLVKMGFFDDTRFFRAVDGFMVQFGISGDPAVAKKWQEEGIPDDPVKQSNKRGFVTFAQRGTPNTRGTQVFINYGDNSRLDATFAPFGQVVQGMEIVDSLYKGYGEGSPMGAGPDQGLIQAQGNAYLDAKFPKLDGIKHAELLQ